MSDHLVSGADCDVDPRHSIQSLAHPYDEHGWTLLSKGIDERSSGGDDERIVRSHALHYMDVAWDPYAGQGADGGSWRHTFVLDALAFVLADGYDDAPGDSAWFVSNDDTGTQIPRSGVRIRSKTNQPAISVRRGQGLVGFVDGRDFADTLWSNDDRGRQFATAIQNSNWSAPDPTTADLGQLAAELDREDELQEAHSSAASFVLGTAVTLGLGGIPGIATGLGLFLLDAMGDDNDTEYQPDPVAFNEGFEGVLDNEAPIQGHRVVFDVYAPRCTSTNFTVESSFGRTEWSAKWNIPLRTPGGWTDVCDDAGVPSETPPNGLSRGERFSATAKEPSSSEWENTDPLNDVLLTPSVEVRSLGGGRYAFDASGTVAANDPTPDSYYVQVSEPEADFDLDDPSWGDIGAPLYEETEADVVQCVQFEEPGDYVVEMTPDAGNGSAWERFTVSPTEFDGPHTLTLESPADGRRHYSIAAESGLEKSDANGASVNDHDTVDGTEAEGILWGGADSYTVQGDLQRICGDDLAVTIDGYEVDPSNYGPDHVLTIESPDDAARQYSLSVEANLQRSTANGASINPGEEVGGRNSTTGHVGGGLDSYTFDGELESLEAEGLTVTLDGREIDPAFYGPERVVTIRSPDNTRENYTLEVSGHLEKSNANRASKDSGDTIDGSVATGQVNNGQDSYAFTGEIVDIEGRVEAYVDDEKVYDGRTLEHVLTIENPNSGFGGQKYSFEVDGTLQKTKVNGASINGNDSIDGNTASGIVYGGTDSYTFDGELLTFDGDVDAYLDGEQIRSADNEEHVVSIDSPDDTRRSYSLVVESALEKSTANGASINDHDTVDGTTAEGIVWDGTDSYTFRGQLRTVEGDGVRVRLDGEVIREGAVPEPTVSIAGPTAVDAGSEVTFRAEPEHFSGAQRYNWGPPVADGNSAFDDGPSVAHTFSAAGSYDVNVTVRGESGEIAGDTVTVDVEPNEPSVDLSADDTSVTTGDTVSFDASTAGFDGSPTLTWQGASGSGASIEQSWTDAGTHTVTVTAEAGDVTVEDSVEVTVREPSVSIDGPTTVQTGESVSFTANVSDFRGSLRYNWGPPVADGNSAFDDGPSVSHTFSSAGSYDVNVTVRGDSGEIAGDVITVDVDEPYNSVSVDLTADDNSVTTDDTVSFDAHVAGGDGSIDYEWSGVGGSGASASRDWSSRGTYTVSVSASDGRTSDSDSVEVTVREPSVSIDGPTNVETGDQVTYSANVADLRGTLRYNWDPPVADGNSAFDDGPSVAHTFASDGSYDVSVTVRGDPGEIAGDAITVDVDEPYNSVSVDLTADDNSVTTGDAVSFDADVAGGDGSIDYEWSGVGGSGSSTSRDWGSGGTYTVSVTASDGRTSDSDSVEVTVREPSVSIDGPTNVETGDSVSYSADVSDFRGSLRYNWGPPVADGNSAFDDGPSVAHTFSSAGNYDVDVTVRGESGEIAGDTVTVDVDSSSSGGGSDDDDDGSSGGGGSGGSDDDDDGSSGGGGSGGSDDDDGSDGGNDADCSDILPDGRTPTGAEFDRYRRCQNRQ